MKAKFMKRRPVIKERMMKLPRVFASNLEKVQFMKYASKEQQKVLRETGQERKEIAEVIADYNDELCILSANQDVRIKYVKVIHAFLEFIKAEDQKGAEEAAKTLEQSKMDLAFQEMKKDAHIKVIELTDRAMCSSGEYISLTRHDMEEKDVLYGNNFRVSNIPVPYTEFDQGLFFYCDKIFFKYGTFCRELHTELTFTQFVHANPTAYKEAGNMSSKAIGQITVYPMVLLGGGLFVSDDEDQNENQ